MLEDLYKREMYGPKLAEKIEAEGSIAVSIANRWALGWPERVADLRKRQFLPRLVPPALTPKNDHCVNLRKL